MKRLTGLMALLLWSLAALAQTPLEILERMEAEMDKYEKDGLVMTVDVKIPILGGMTTKTYSLGDRTRVEAEMMGVKIITWEDGESEWTYNSKNNEVEIKKFAAAAPSEENGDSEMFKGIADGYDVSINKETADAWYLQCKKRKDNPDKDAPKTMDVVVAKGTYYPLSLSTKMKGITLTMKDISFGVSEAQVTFNAADYPGVTIKDSR